jgi:hypothetical protein
VAADVALFTNVLRGTESPWRENTKPEKKQYEPPQVTAIQLRPEEAVLSFCKNTSSAGQFSSCHHTGGNCHGIGS